MKKMYLKLVLFCLWRLVGAFGFTEQASKSLMEGESVTLEPTFASLNPDIWIQWRFGKYLIVDANVTTSSITVYDDVLDGRFKNRLKMNIQTGSLTITNITIEHAGDYEIRFKNTTLRSSFFLTVCKDILVTEGGSVTLNPDRTEISNNDIKWQCERGLADNLPLNTAAGRFFESDSCDWRFRDRLKLDKQTGSLTITNITITLSGYYKLKITGGKWSSKAFRVYVYDRLPYPVISRSFSSSSNCSLFCSVFNVSLVGPVTLSWYKGNNLLSHIRVHYRKINLILPLEVEYQDKNSYSCVLNNPISNQTQHLDISKLCHTCSDSVHCCGPTEAVIRLVLSALVGVATVLILVYGIRSRRAEQDPAHIHTTETIEN